MTTAILLVFFLVYLGMILGGCLSSSSTAPAWRC